VIEASRSLISISSRFGVGTVTSLETIYLTPLSSARVSLLSPYALLKELFNHPLTAVGIECFLKGWAGVPE